MIPRAQLSWTLRETLAIGLSFLRPGKNTRSEKLGLFERDLADILGVEETLMVGRARYAFELVLKSLELPPGSVVGLSPITIRGMLDVVVGLGLTPVFYDIDPDTMKPNEDSLLNIRESVSAVLLTPLFGISGDFGETMRLLRAWGKTSILDISQAWSTSYAGNPIWIDADYVIASFSALKTIDSIGGGCLFSPRNFCLSEIRKIQSENVQPTRGIQARTYFRNLLIAIFGLRVVTSILVAILRVLDLMTPGIAIRQTGPRNSTIQPGLSNRFRVAYTWQQTELARSCLDSEDNAVQRRIANTIQFRNLIRAMGPTSQISVPATESESESDFWQFVVFSDDPHRLQRRLWTYGVDSGSTSLSYLPSCYHLGKKITTQDFQGASKVYFNSLFIPNHSRLKQRDVNTISKALLEITLQSVPHS